MQTLLEPAAFIALANLVTAKGITTFVDTNADGEASILEAAARLGVHAYACAPQGAAAISARWPDFDVYDGDGVNFLKDVLPKLDGPTMFWVNRNTDPEFAMIDAASEGHEWLIQMKSPEVSPMTREQFDRNWAGPPMLKPVCFRSQSEKDTWYACVVENEYRAPTFRPDDVVIDIGGHIGGFAFKAFMNGSREVYSFEIDPWHIEAGEQNLRELTGVRYNHLAVVRSDDKRAAEYRYKGDWNSFASEGDVVESVSLDEILAEFDRVRFIKIDCEGGEWPILYTCTMLDRVAEIAGEYHTLPGVSKPELYGLGERSAAALKAFLEGKGFAVEIQEAGDNIGLFFATRK